MFYRTRPSLFVIADYRTYREEVLDMYLFRNIDEVQLITDKWLREYNGERPHESLGNLTPKGYKGQLVSTNALY